MPDGSIDVGSLEGDALARWYLRSPSEIEQAREDAEAKHYQDFFYGPSGTDSHAGVTLEARTARRDTGPEGAMGSIHLPPATPPLPTFFSSLFGGPAPLTSPGGHVVGYYDHQAAKAGLEITAQYAKMAPWLQPAGWIDGLIAGGGRRVALSEAAPAIRAVESGLKGPLNFLEREAWQRGAQKALTDAQKNALRASARAKFARANGVSASEMKAEVHHSDPLEWAHLKPGADPNRLANLWGLRREAHEVATREWSAFAKSLAGRIPS